jgi:hypothetical protein
MTFASSIVIGMVRFAAAMQRALQIPTHDNEVNMSCVNISFFSPSFFGVFIIFLVKLIWLGFQFECGSRYYRFDDWAQVEAMAYGNCF